MEAATSKSDALDRFKQFCLRDHAQTDQYLKIDPSEEQDWFSLSLGFFAALGLNSEDAHELAIEARYKQQYWH